jgi:hypothetical protein
MQTLQRPPSPSGRRDLVELQGDEICIASGDRLALLRLSGDVVLHERTVVLPSEVDRLRRSSSRRFVAGRRSDGARFWVWDLVANACVLQIDAADPARQRIDGTFCRVRGQDIVLCTRQGSELEGYRLDGTPLFAYSCETFRFSQLIAFDEEQSLLALGFFDGESKDSLAVVDLGRASTDNDSLFAQFRTKSGVTDYAYRLEAAPCGRDAFVAFRDPEDDESDDADGRRELYGYRGLYVRRLDGSAIERLTTDALPSDHHVIAGGRTWIAIAGPDDVRLLPRRGPGTERIVRGTCVAIDGAAERILVQDEQHWHLLRL